MAWWQDALCAIGLATCAPAPPDVSAQTILSLLTQTGGQDEVFPLALGSLYEEVALEADGFYALKRDGQTFATTRCEAALDCRFSYRDTPSRLRAFALQAEIWAEHEVGPLRRGANGTVTATSAERELSINTGRDMVVLILRPGAN